MTDTVIVDEGSSQIKCAWVSNNTIHTHMIKARAKYGRLETMDGGVSDAVYDVDGREIAISDIISDPIQTSSDHYQTSDINRALVHEALRLAGFGGKPVDLIVTLPVDTFYKDKSKRDDKKAHILKPVTNVNDLPLASIQSVRVAPEAVPVLDSLCLDDLGQMVDGYDDLEKIMIVDIGGTTTDITLINSDNILEKRQSVKIGVFDIIRELRNRLFEDPKIDARDPSFNALENTLRTGLFRNKTDVKKHIDAASQMVAGRLISTLNALQSDPEDLDFVTYVGGGAHLLQPLLRKQYGGTTRKHPNPEFAVALGLLKNERSQEPA
ncbi:MAG: ParM/StbA family protein [Candidatus Thiodiazotropha weberae]|nr:ParM/StbA family protein [Candidatus Thiodiazotropha weberae]